MDGKHKIKIPRLHNEVSMWEHTGSNRGPSACKADALNQLSYAPFFGSANIRDPEYSKKFKSILILSPFCKFLNIYSLITIICS